MTGRVCNTCGEFKDAENFTPFKGGKNSLYPCCKRCRIPAAKKQWKSLPIEKKILRRTKSRAKIKNRDFSLTLEDIIIPPICPILGIPMDTPSIDRIDSSRGYTPDNIQIISNRANMLKNNATLEELRKIVAHLEVITIGDISDG